MQSPGRRGLTADGQTGLPLLSIATWPQPRQLWHRISPFSEAGSPDAALNMAKSVAPSSLMSLLSAAEIRRRRCRMPCRRALRQREGHHESAAADLGGGSCCCGTRDATA
eukprot:4995744-Pleurochrysis_carterae.AAC.1